MSVLLKAGRLVTVLHGLGPCADKPLMPQEAFAAREAHRRRVCGALLAGVVAAAQCDGELVRTTCASVPSTVTQGPSFVVVGAVVPAVVAAFVGACCGAFICRAPRQPQETECLTRDVGTQAQCTYRDGRFRPCMNFEGMCEVLAINTRRAQ